MRLCNYLNTPTGCKGGGGWVSCIHWFNHSPPHELNVHGVGVGGYSVEEEREKKKVAGLSYV